MSLIRNLKVSVIFFTLLTICTNGDTGSLPVDMQSLSKDNDNNDKQMAMYPNTIYYPNTYTMYPRERSTMMHGKSIQDSEESKFTFNNFFDAMNDLNDEELNPRSRASTKFAPVTYTKPLYSYPKHGFASWPANVYQDTNLLTPPLESANMWKPKFGLLESGMKAPNKLGSLLNIGSAILGGSGFKDTLINNILRPLLASKAGLKALMAKLSIPVVALVLVNVEILLVVWWLWEECPESQPVEPVTPFSSQTPVSNYSNFK